MVITFNWSLGKAKSDRLLVTPRQLRGWFVGAAGPYRNLFISTLLLAPKTPGYAERAHAQIAEAIASASRLATAYGPKGETGFFRSGAAF